MGRPQPPRARGSRHRDLRDAADITSVVAAGIVPNLACLALGLWILSGLRIRCRAPELWALAFVLGTGVSSGRTGAGDAESPAGGRRRPLVSRRAA